MSECNKLLLSFFIKIENWINGLRSSSEYEEYEDYEIHEFPVFPDEIEKSCISYIASTFSLNEFEGRVILLLAYVAFNALKNDDSSWVSGASLLNMLSSTDENIDSNVCSFLHNSPLRANGIIRRHKNKNGNDEFKLSDDVFHHLIYSTLVPEELLPYSYSGAVEFHSHNEHIQELSVEWELLNYFISSISKNQSQLVTLTGHTIDSLLETVLMTTERFGRRTLVLDVKLFSDKQTNKNDALCTLHRYLRITNSILVIKGICFNDNIDSSQQWLIDRLDTLRSQVIILQLHDQDLLWVRNTAHIHIGFQRNTWQQKAKLLLDYCEKYEEITSEGIYDIASKYDVSLPSLGHIIAEADLYCHSYGGVVTDAVLEKAFRMRSSQNYSGLAQRMQPVRNRSDLVVSTDTEQHLSEIIKAIKGRESTYRAGFAKKVNYGTGISILFYGPSGTGKTMAAEVMASELGTDIIKADLSQTVSKYIGETEKNLSQIFRLAESDGGILFFDEADALFGKRSDVKEAKDRYANIEVSYLLQKLENHTGVVILSTNNKNFIDNAFSRRFTFIVRFDFPDSATRVRLWRRIWPESISVSDEIDWNDIAEHYTLTGAGIRNTALLATWSARAENENQIQLRHIKHALARELSKTGVIIK